MAMDPATAQGKTPWPSDDDMVALMAEHESFAAVARSQGKARKSLRDYLRTRPELDGRMREHIPAKLTPEERLEHNRISKRDYARRKQAENPEILREQNRKWARNRNPAKRRQWNIYNRVRRAGAKFTDAAKEYTLIIEADPCVYCGGLCEHVDHIDPLARGGTGDWDNITSACASCNISKGDRPILQFLLARKPLNV